MDPEADGLFERAERFRSRRREYERTATVVVNWFRQGTTPLGYFDDITECRIYGRHTMYGYWGALKGGWRSRRLGGPKQGDDLRKADPKFQQPRFAGLQGQLEAAAAVDLVAHCAELARAGK